LSFFLTVYPGLDKGSIFMNTAGLSAIQIETLEHIYSSYEKKINPICSLDAGLGKTWVGCEVIGKNIKEKKNAYRILIVHKASNYKDPWIEALRLYDFITEPIGSGYKQNTKAGYIYIHGKERIDMNLRGGKYYLPGPIILLTSFETLCLDIEHNYFDLAEAFNLIIFDEIHKIINHRK
jgi:superfamily II DNA or RNA helicase